MSSEENVHTSPQFRIAGTGSVKVIAPFRDRQLERLVENDYLLIGGIAHATLKVYQRKVG